MNDASSDNTLQLLKNLKSNIQCSLGKVQNNEAFG
jgi:hypothetical protein